jgi:hypothetical protein
MSTNQAVHESVGRCNRVDKCGYHLKPGQYFLDHPGSENRGARAPVVFTPEQNPEPEPFSFIPVEVFKRSRGHYDQNRLVIYLSSLFGDEITSTAIGNYHVGTSRHWPGSTVFWQIDKRGITRTGKIMLYDAISGHRVKKPFNHITWAHAALKIDNYTLRQCFFGEHLLNSRRSSVVAIVESEKTAIIASIYLPEFTWLAVGSLTNLTREKCEVLKGRKVILFPDLNGFDKWATKAKEFKPIGAFTVSDLLETIATDQEKQNGLDLADYLVRFDHKKFHIEPKKPATRVQAKSQPPATFSFIGDNDAPLAYPGVYIKKPRVSWDIKQLQNFFENTVKVDSPLRLNQCCVITDVPLFIQSHMDIIRANDGTETYAPYYQRLRLVKEILSLKSS